MLPLVDVVVVNWNAGRQLGECLAAVRSSAQARHRLGQLVVVDNASTDNSLALPAATAPDLVIRNDLNRGFAAACNQGARAGTSPYLLFLNPDTRVDRDALDNAIAHLEAATASHIGILGARLYDEGGTVAKTSARFPTSWTMVARSLGLDRTRIVRGYLMTDWAHDDTRMVDHVIGAFYLVRRAVFESLSGFDERYFVYLEDLDFSCRAHRAGWRTLYAADVKVFHKGGGTSEQVRGRRLAYALRSRIAYSRRHFTIPGAAAVLVTTLVAEPIIRLGWGLLRRAPGEVSETLEAFQLIWRWRTR